MQFIDKVKIKLKTAVLRLLQIRLFAVQNRQKHHLWQDAIFVKIVDILYP